MIGERLHYILPKKYHIGLGPEPAAYMDVVAMLNDAMEEQQQ